MSNEMFRKVGGGRGPWLQPFMAVLAAVVLAACGGDGNGDGDGDDPGDGGPPVSGDTDDGTRDATVPESSLPPADETVRISYAREARITSGSMPDEIQLVVMDTSCRVGDCPGGATIVSGHDLSCSTADSCRLSTSAGFVVFRDPLEATTLRSAALDENYQLTGPSTVLGTDVRRFVERNDVVVWISGDEAYARSLSAGQTVELGRADGDDSVASGASIALSEDGQRAYLLGVGLNRMSIFEIPTAGGERRLVHRLASNSTSSSGSLISGLEPMTKGDDEFFYIAVNAILLAEPCSTSDDCGGHRFCSRDTSSGRCAEFANYVVRISTEDGGLLDTACSNSSQCGAGHVCDSSFINPSTQQGTCVPGRLRLGTAGSNACNGLQEGEYTGVLPRISTLSDGRIAMIASSPCENGAINRTEIVAAGPSLDGVEVLAPMSGVVHGGPDCLDSTGTIFNYEQCAVELREMVLSPSGGTVVAIGASVNNANGSQIWVFDPFGRQDRFPLEVRLFDGERDGWRFRNLRTHP